jgi:hypothetical protein
MYDERDLSLMPQRKDPRMRGKVMDKPTVRYERLRPGQIVARRSACPVAYLPIGTIE